MERAPTVPMISLNLRKSDMDVDFTKVKTYISRTFQFPASTFENEFKSFLAARKNACDPTCDYTGLSHQKYYYCQLGLFIGHFEITPITDHAVTWKWYESFSSAKHESSDIRLEEASILYNLAALHSMLADKENRSNAESMKIACTHYQCSSWALNTLVERHLPISGSNDLNSDLVLVLAVIMLAQAQECVLEKSILDKRSTNVVSKLARYLAETYEDVFGKLNSTQINESLPAKFLKDLKQRTRVKGALFSALSAYYMGLNEEADKHYGRSVAWLQNSSKLIEDAYNLAKDSKLIDTSSSSSLRTVIKPVLDLIQAKAESAFKDNDFIYHEVVPNHELLERIDGVCLVKGVPFDRNDPETRGQDIFQRLVPMNVLESNSVYSEMKATLLRTMVNDVEAKECDIDQFVVSLYLNPNTMLTPDPPLPQGVYDWFARVDAFGSDLSVQLTEQMAKLVDGNDQVELQLKTLGEKFDNLESFETAFSVNLNDKKKSFKQRVSMLKQRLKSLSEVNEQSRQSNTQLREVINQHIDIIKELCPSLDDFIKNLDSVNDLVEAPELKKLANDAELLFNKVDEMRKQRDDLVNQLRKALHDDDVTSDLLVTGKNTNELTDWFNERLKSKHDHLVGVLKQNLAAQENIKSAMIDLNAEYSPKWEELNVIREKRIGKISELLSTNETYDAILLKCEQGISFYEMLLKQLLELDADTDKLIEDWHKHLQSQTEKLQKDTMLSSMSGQSLQGPLKQTLNHPPPNVPTLGDYLKSVRLSGNNSHPVQMRMGMTSSPTVQPYHQPIALGQARQPNTPFPQHPNPQQPRLTQPQQQSHQPSYPIQQSQYTQPHQQPQPVPPHLYSESVEHPRPAQPQRYPQPIQQTQPVHQQQFTQPYQYPHPPTQSQQYTQPTQQFQPNDPQRFVRPYQQPHSSLPQQALPTRPQQPMQSGQQQHSTSMQERYVQPFQQQQPPNIRQQQQYTQQYHQPHPIQQQQQSQHVGFPQNRTPQPQPVRPQQTHQSCTQSLSGQSRPPPNVINSHGQSPMANQMHPLIRTPTPTAPGSRPILNTGNYPPASTVTATSNPAHVPQLPHSTIPTTNQMRTPYTQPNMQFNTRPTTPNYSNQHYRPIISNTGQPPLQPVQPMCSRPNEQILPRSSYPLPQNTPANRPYFTSQQPVQQFRHPSDMSTHSISQPQSEASSRRYSQTNQPNFTQMYGPSPVSYGHQMGPTRVVSPQTNIPNPTHSNEPNSLNNFNQTNPNDAVSAGCLLQPQQTVTKIANEVDSKSGRTVEQLSVVNPHTDQIVPNNVEQTNTDHTSSNESAALTINTDGTSSDQILTKPVISDRHPESSLTDDPVVLERFITSAKQLLTWLDNSDELISDSTQINNGTKTLTRLGVAWNQMLASTNDFANSVYYNKKKPTQAVALCCPSKNRDQSIIPFDFNRVILSNNKQNDYINASYIDFSPSLGDWCPRYIITQAPLPKTVMDFWSMIMQECCEIVVFLQPHYQRSPNPDVQATVEGAYGDLTDPLHIPAHLPPNKIGSRFVVPGSSLEIRLQSIKHTNPGLYVSTTPDTDSDQSSRSAWTERILTLQNLDTQTTRSLVHFTYHHQPVSSTTTTKSIEQFVNFINHVHNYYKQQRSLSRPICVVCNCGSDQSGLFILSYVSILQTKQIGGDCLTNLFQLSSLLCQQRRKVLSHQSQLYATAQVLSQAVIQLAAQHGVLIGPIQQNPVTEPTPACSTVQSTTTSDLNLQAKNSSVDHIFSEESMKVDDLLSVLNNYYGSQPAAKGNMQGNCIEQHQYTNNNDHDKISELGQTPLTEFVTHNQSVANDFSNANSMNMKFDKIGSDMTPSAPPLT